MTKEELVAAVAARITLWSRAIDITAPNNVMLDGIAALQDFKGTVKAAPEESLPVLLEIWLRSKGGEYGKDE